MRSVFVSYSRTDRAYVERLCEYLTAAGLRCWYDYEIATGDRFDKVIAQQIETCSAVVVVMTPASFQSDWVANEIKYAQDIGKSVLPLLLSGTAFISLSSRDHENVTGGRMPGRRFLDHLQSLAAIDAVAADATARPAPPRRVDRPPARPPSPPPPPPVERAIAAPSTPADAPPSSVLSRAPRKPAIVSEREPSGSSHDTRAKGDFRFGVGFGLVSVGIGGYAAAHWWTWAALTYGGLVLAWALLCIVAYSARSVNALHVGMFLIALPSWILLVCAGISFMWQLWFLHRGVGWSPPIAALVGAFGSFISTGLTVEWLELRSRPKPTTG